MFVRRFILIGLTCCGLTACGGSNNDSTATDTYPQAYLQFYNASSNSAATSLALIEADSDELSAGSATFGDVTAISSLDDTSYTAKLSWTPATTVTTIKTQALTLNKGEKSILTMLGDFAAPELLQISFSRDDSLSSQFKVALLNLAGDNQSYDLYISTEGQTFASAKQVSSAAYKTLSSFQTYSNGSYIFYLTKSGSDQVLLTSQVVSLSYQTEYVLALRRNNSPAATTSLVLDLIDNTSSVTTLEDASQPALFRLYNSIDNSGQASVYLGDSQQPLLTGLATDTLTSYQSIEAGDKRLTLVDEYGNTLVRNGLLTANQGMARSVLFYQNSAGQGQTLTVTESQAPQVYDFVFHSVNLISDFNQISLYFVRPGYTIDTTPYYITTLNYASQSQQTLPTGTYTIYAVYSDLNNNKRLLAQTPATTLQAGSSYIVIAEPDVRAASGYKVSLLR